MFRNIFYQRPALQNPVVWNVQKQSELTELPAKCLIKLLFLPVYIFHTNHKSSLHTIEEKIEHDEVPHGMCKDLYEFTGSTQIKVLPSCTTFRAKIYFCFGTEQENLLIFPQTITLFTSVWQVGWECRYNYSTFTQSEAPPYNRAR